MTKPQTFAADATIGLLLSEAEPGPELDAAAAEYRQADQQWRALGGRADAITQELAAIDERLADAADAARKTLLLSRASLLAERDSLPGQRSHAVRRRVLAELDYLARVRALARRVVGECDVELAGPLAENVLTARTLARDKNRLSFDRMSDQERARLLQENRERAHAMEPAQQRRTLAANLYRDLATTVRDRYGPKVSLDEPGAWPDIAAAVAQPGSGRALLGVA